MATEKRPVEDRLRGALHSVARDAPLPPDFAASVADTLPDRSPAPSSTRRLALPFAAVTAGALVVAVLAIVLWRPEAPAPGNGSDWGPLAVTASTGGDEALATGTLQVGSDCVVLDQAGDQTTKLVWPADRTTWAAATRSITFVTLEGMQVTLTDGDSVTFVGGGDSAEESGVSGESWRDGIEWIAPPADGCPLESRWSVGDLVTAPAALDDEVDRLFADTTECRAELAGHPVLITYPGTWWTNEASSEFPACFWFAPEPVVVPLPLTTRPAGVAITLGSAGGPFGSSGTPAVTEDVMVSGREGIRVEEQGSTSGYGEGLPALVYQVALGETATGPTLVAVTRQVDSGDYALNKAVLDRMMELLVIE